MRSIIARALVNRAVRDVPVRVVYPDGSTQGRGGPDSPAIEIVEPSKLFRRVARNPKVGIGEGYVAGEWRVSEGTDLAGFFLPFAERLSGLLPDWLLRLRRLADRRHPTGQRNTLRGSRRNIEAHYDLSNDLFALFLDETLSYSSAMFDPVVPRSDQSLESAQRRKIENALDLAGVESGMRVLEIGSGWGSLAIAAAERGAHVTTITLSREQQALARERVAAAGLGDQVDVVLRDYREVDGKFDAVVSIEMIEAVGDEYWATYFEAIDRALRPGGKAVIQAILMDHDRYLTTRNSFGWIQKHIFPGGMIPSIEGLTAAGAGTELELSGVEAFGDDYAETLRRWRSRFLENWARVAELGFDEQFRRTWEYYLAYCEAGFDAGYLDVAQLTFEKQLALETISLGQYELSRTA